MAQLVVHLPNNCQILGSIHTIKKKEEETEKRRRREGESSHFVSNEFQRYIEKVSFVPCFRNMHDWMTKNKKLKR
jgi:hypothetical protein